MTAFAGMRNGELVKIKQMWCYDTLGTAKNAMKTHIKSRNKNLPKDQRWKFHEFTIMEYELIPKQEHLL